MYLFSHVSPLRLAFMQAQKSQFPFVKIVYISCGQGTSPAAGQELVVDLARQEAVCESRSVPVVGWFTAYFQLGNVKRNGPANPCCGN